MSNNILHRRTCSSSTSKPSKIQRPALVRGQSSPRLHSLGKKRATEIETTPDSDHQDSDMTFLQYCPTCDVQIIVPNSSVLYCSESCRRKDSAFRAPSMTHDSPLSSDSEASSTATRTIVQPRSPSTLATFHSKPPTIHDFKPDLDPTEWKPDSSDAAVAAGDSVEGRPHHHHHHRAHSAASNYLTQFHSTTAGLVKSCRPGLPSRASTSALPLARTAPSLTATPATSAANSTSSDESGFLRTPDSSSHASVTLKAYRRSGIYAGVKSVDLVKPVFSDQMAAGECEGAAKSGALDYRKESIVRSRPAAPEEVPVAGSLSKLLEGEMLAV